jgi:hypothetical protein
LVVARDQAKKDDVLERLTYLPRDVNVDLESIFEKYAGSRVESDRLYESYLKINDPPLLNVRIVQKWVVAELVKQGIEPERAKKAFESVLMEKMDEEVSGNPETMMLGLQKLDMLNRCLSKLKKDDRRK